MMTKNLKRSVWFLCVAFSVLSLSGCSGHASRIEQSKVCVFSSLAQASKCKNGEIAFFRPNSWGNDQLPLDAVSVFCNTNHQVIYNKSGVVCQFTNKRYHPAKAK
jgi:hypothetical protein